MNEKTKNVLIINTVGMKFEGISSVIFNFLESFKCMESNINFTILCYENTDNSIVEKIKKNALILYVPDRKKEVMKYVICLSKILKYYQFDAVHIHGNSGTMFIETAIAKIYGVENILVHAHNVTCSHPCINCILKKPMIVSANKLLACSNLAGNWLYGKNKFTIINNAINYEKYVFDGIEREKVRQKLNIDDGHVIGHVGGFSVQKNHLFLLNVFKKYLAIDDKAILMLVGDGQLREKIKNKVAELDIQDKVIFIKPQENVKELYSAMDVFLFPSNWESLGLVALEAQVNGLKTIISKNVPKDVSINSSTEFLPLCEDEWVYSLKKMMWGKRETFDINRLTKSGFNIEYEAHKLKELYF